MKTIFIIIVTAILFIIVLLYILGVKSKTGAAAGLIEEKLSQCSSKPNCVCSEIKLDDEHYIEPVLVSENNGEASLNVMKQVIQEMGGVLEYENDNYAAYQFTSEGFGFVDDLEIRLDMQQKMIHIRSASRVGYSDRGVNRTRVEKLIENYKKKMGL